MPPATDERSTPSMNKSTAKTLAKKLRGSLYMEYRKYPGLWTGNPKYAKKLMTRKVRHELKMVHMEI